MDGGGSFVSVFPCCLAARGALVGKGRGEGGGGAQTDGVDVVGSDAYTVHTLGGRSGVACSGGEMVRGRVG